MKFGGSLHDPDDFVLYVNEPAAYCKVVMPPSHFWQLHEAVLAHAAMLRAKQATVEIVTDE